MINLQTKLYYCDCIAAMGMVKFFRAAGSGLL